MASGDDGLRWDPRWGGIVAASLVVAAVVAFFGERWLQPSCVERECPSLERIASYRPPEPPRVLDQDGELAGSLSGDRRIVVSLDSVPDIVRDGYIAVEDHRFHEHDGVDVWGATRAFFRNVVSGGVQEGASTITMQLARNIFGSDVLQWNRWHRKLAEIRLARAMEEELSKDRILELYLNQIYLGDGVYGVQAASLHYFGHSVTEVTPREAAMLVGLARNPEGYDPEDHPERANERIATVLDVMVRRGVIDQATAAEARESELELAAAGPVQEWGANAYYLAAVRRELRELYPDPAERAGLRVHTGLDQVAQETAVEALGDQIRSVESGRWGYFPHQTAPESPELVGVGSTSPYLQGMVVAMRPEDGLVTTLVGGRDYEHSEFDRAFQAKRQPGSAFKPIVYAAALGQGLRLNQTISTDPVRFAQRGSDDWQPADHVSGEELTVRDALVRSSNTAAVRVGQRVGPGMVARQARAMGIESDIPEWPSVYLGAMEVVPAELVSAFATLINGGYRIEPYLITRIETPAGAVVYRREASQGARAVDPRIGFLLTDILRDVTTRGTGWRVGQSGLSYPAAGKTGTTNESKDLWFVGMTPKLVAGVWLGFDNPQEVVPGAGGGTLAAPVFARFMQVANRNLAPMDPWSAPSGITRATIDLETGYAVAEDCPPRGEVRTEYFIAGTEPREFCPYHRFRGDSLWWRTDTARSDRWDEDRRRWEDRVRRDDSGRTVFYRGEDEEDEGDEDARRRLERLDSLERARREERDDRRRFRDTIRIDRTDTLRSDTLGTDTVGRDTARVDTTRSRDTTRRGDTTRSRDTTTAGQTPTPSFSATSPASAPGSAPSAPASMPPWASHRSASRAAMHPLPAAVTAWR